jgi:hypothetical protein
MAGARIISFLEKTKKTTGNIEKRKKKKKGRVLLPGNRRDKGASGQPTRYSGCAPCRTSGSRVSPSGP